MKSKTTKVRRYLAAILTVLMIFQQATTSVIYASSEAAVPTVTEAPAAQTEETPEKQVEETPEEKTPTEGENDGEESAAPTEAPTENEAEPEVTVTPAAEPTATEAPAVEATATPVPEATPTEVPTAASFTTADGIASVNLTQPIPANAKFVATAQDADSDYFYNNVDAAMGAWVESNGLSVVDATAYDMHFEADGQELAVNQSATVHINFPAAILTQKPETGIQTTYYVLHIKNGTAVPAGTVNGDASGAYSADITTDGFSPFVFVKAASEDAIQTAAETPKSKNLKDFLKDIEFSKNSQPTTELKKSTTYNLNLKFAEGEALQFDEDPFTYTLPDSAAALIQLTDGTNFTSELKGVCDGTPFTIPVNFSVNSGVVTVSIDKTNQDNYNKYTRAADAQFSLNLSATVLESAQSGEFSFSDSVKKTITINDEHSVSVKKTGEYNKQTGSFDYELTVTSVGQNNQVTVNDSITGNLLTLDPTTIKVNWNAVTNGLTVNGNQFTYVKDKMEDGESFKIQYSAKIDYSKLGVDSKAFTVEQTGNTVNVNSQEDPDGSHDEKNFEHTVIFDNNLNKAATNVADGQNGKKIVDWEITINGNCLKSVVGSTVSDSIATESQGIMSYYGDGFTVTKYDKNNSKVRTDTVSWNSIGVDTNTSKSWTWSISGNSGEIYKYVISYQTIVDNSNLWENTNVKNSVTFNGETKEAEKNIEPGNTWSVDKSHTQVDTNAKTVSWKVEIRIPKSGFSKFIITDTLPNVWVNNVNFRHQLDGEIEISGIQSDETYTLSSNPENSNFEIKFSNGLKPTSSDRTITLTYKTKYPEIWSDDAVHYNDVKVETEHGFKSDRDGVTINNVKIRKTFLPNESTPIDGIYSYRIEVSGVTDEKVEIQDSLGDAEQYFEICDSTIKVGAGVNYWDTYNEISGEVKYDASKHLFSFTAAKDQNNLFYGWYGFSYKVKVKQDKLKELRQNAVNNKGSYNFSNIASYKGVSASAEAVYSYNTPMQKTLINEPTDSNGYIATFKIIVNKDGLTLNKGKSLTVDDTMTNLQYIYDSMKISPNPSNNIKYTLGENSIRWTGIPDSTTVEIEYKAKVIGTGQITYSNSANLTGGYSSGTGDKEVTVSYKGSGQSNAYSVKIVKIDSADPNKLLKGAIFELYLYENGQKKKITKTGTSTEVVPTYTTDDSGEALIVSDQDTNGWALWPGKVYCIHESKAPEGYTAGPDQYFCILAENQEWSGSGLSCNIVSGANEQILIPNSKNTKTIDISVTKEWKDANNQDGKRPQSIKVQLYADGNESGTPVELTSDSGWTYTWRDLAEKNEGKAITYTVKEVGDVAGYTASEPTGNAEQGFVLTNSHTPETIKVEGTKNWKDNDDQDGKRPESIKVNLIVNGVLKESKTVTAEDNWKYSFGNLPKYEKGVKVIYTVTEDAVEGYSTKIEGYNITNTYTPGKTSVTVTKRWLDNDDQDGKRPQSIKVQLYADGKESGTPVVVTGESGWTYTWRDLAEKNEGKAITYTVKEVGDVAGYTASEPTGNAEQGFVLTNSHTPETIKVEGTKNWKDNDDQDGKRPESIKVNLIVNGVLKESKTVTAEDNWKYSFGNLPKYEKGVKVIYTVTEDAVEGYSTKIEGYNITNTYTPGKTSVTVTKRWLDNDDQDGKRPQSIKVQLYADGKESGTPVVVTGESGWTYTWINLAEKKKGKAITYTVKEVGTVEGYEAFVSGDARTGYTITNDYTKILVKIGKVDATNQKELEGAHIQVIDKDGKIVDEWTSVKEPHVVNNLKPGETYTLRETVAPDGYTVTSDTTFTLKEDGTVDQTKTTATVSDEGVVLVEDNMTSVSISKVDITSQKELAGAHIQILDKDGKVVEEWDSTDKAYTIKGLKTGETYTLRETVAPNGYYRKADTTFTLKADGSIDTEKTTTTISKEGILLVEDTAIPTPDVPSGPTAKISKVDVTSQQELEGAKLQVIDKNGNVVDEWISGKTAHVTTELKAGETYTLRETVAPDGYLITSDTTFTLKEDGTVDESKTTTKVKDGVLLVEDTKAVSVNISKVDATNQKELEGAHIQIVDKDGKIVDEWTSGKEPHVVNNLKPGETYTLRETVAPDGYTVTSDTTFTLKEDGTVDQTKTTATVSDKGVVLVEDNMTSVSISKVDITSQKELAGAHIQILDKDGKVVEEWDSTDKAYTIKGLKTGETYTLRETVAPKGYKVAEDTTFQLNEDGTIDTANTTTAISDDTLLVKDEKKESKDVSVSVTKKLVTVDGTVIGAEDATYYVALYSDADCTERVSDVLALNFKNASSSTVTFTGLEKGQTYYVGECEADGTCYLANICADGTMYMVDFSDGNAVTVDNADGSTTVYFDNQFEKIPDGYYKEAELNITKKLVGSDGKAKNSNEIFYAGIFADEGFTQLSTDVSQNIVPLDLAGGSEATALVNVALPESGSITLYVTEVDSNGKPVAGAASFKYDVTVDNAQVTLNDDNLSANVVITNTENSTKVTPTPGTPNTPNTTGGFSGKSAVRTGDSTPIGGFIALFAAAAVIAGAAVFFKRRRKDEK